MSNLTHFWIPNLLSSKEFDFHGIKAEEIILADRLNNRNILAVCRFPFSETIIDNVPNPVVHLDYYPFGFPYTDEGPAKVITDRSEDAARSLVLEQFVRLLKTQGLLKDDNTTSTKTE